MKNESFFVSYLLFLFLFFSSTAFRFESEVPSEVLVHSSGPWVFALLILASAALLVSLRNIFKVRTIYLAVASLMGTLLLSTVFLHFEEKAVEKAWLKDKKHSSFSQMSGHCSPRVGRAMLRFLDGIFKKKAEGELREFGINSWCRLKHFRYLEERGAEICTPKESASKCNLRWAVVFAGAGDWEGPTRRFFFERAIDAWQKDQDSADLVTFVLKDQELVSMSRGKFEDSRIQSRLIFEKVATLIQDSRDKARVEPYQLKFKDAFTEFHVRSNRER